VNLVRIQVKVGGSVVPDSAVRGSVLLLVRLQDVFLRSDIPLVGRCHVDFDVAFLNFAF